MQRLIWECYVTDEYTYSYTDTIPFEYSSKDDFCLKVLDDIQKGKEKRPDYPMVEVLGVTKNCEDVEDIEHQVFTIDEWFNKNKAS